MASERAATPRKPFIVDFWRGVGCEVEADLDSWLWHWEVWATTGGDEHNAGARDPVYLYGGLDASEPPPEPRRAEQVTPVYN